MVNTRSSFCYVINCREKGIGNADSEEPGVDNSPKIYPIYFFHCLYGYTSQCYNLSMVKLGSGGQYCNGYDILETVNDLLLLQITK